MAQTYFEGSPSFPTTANDVYGLVEKLAVQNITALKGANPIANAFYEYDVDGNGNVIEESVIEMAEAGTFDKNTPNFAPKDPVFNARYFNNWEEKQFKTTIRKNDIRKVIADGKGESVEGVVNKILSSLNEGEADYDKNKMGDALYNLVGHAAYLGNVKSSYGDKHPKNMKGVIYAIREAYNALKSTNSFENADDDVSGKYAVDPSYIRIAISENVLNLIDVTTLADMLHLEKAELMGTIVKIDDSTNFEEDNVLVYDVRAMGRGTRVYEYSQDVIGSTLYSNHYLTTERCYFYNTLFKALFFNCAKAIETARAELLEANA